MESDDSSKWMEAMNEELKSMAHNGVWDLIELPNSCKPVGCKWVFKTKREAKGNIERFKARLWPKVSLKRKVSITKIPSLRFPTKIRLESSWHL